MALTLDLGIPAITGNLTMPVMDISKLGLAETERKADEVTYTSTSAPLGRPLTLNFGRRIVSNVYTNSSVQPAFRTAQAQGIKILVNLSSVASVTSDTESGVMASFRRDYPVTSRLTITVPAIDLLTGDDLLRIVEFHLGACFNGAVNATRLTELARGALVL